MNTDDNSTSTNDNLVDMEDLNKFEETFFQKEAPKPEPIAKEKVAPKTESVDSEEIEDDSLATDEEDTDADASLEEEDDDQTEEKAPEEGVAQKKGKKSFQERINELTAKAREAERREQESNRKLIDLQSARSTTEVKPPEPAPQPLREQLPSDAPSPDAVDDKGEALYELGEFDPAYIRDLTRFSVQQETAIIRQREAEQQQAQNVTAAQQKLASDWAIKVEKAETDLPDLRSNIATVAAQFQNIEPGYGEYLASTIMESEAGAEIMDYLSQNIGEAQKIVASGPRAATLAIGRLEARFVKDDQSAEDTSNENTKLVSKAPNPPSNSSKGRGARTTTRADTDDLDAFEKLFFNT